MGIPGKGVNVAIGDNSREHVSIAKPIDLARCVPIIARNGRLPSTRRCSSQAVNSDDAREILVCIRWILSLSALDRRVIGAVAWGIYLGELAIRHVGKLLHYQAFGAPLGGNLPKLTAMAFAFRN